ncbi:MAG: hypothetical protein KF760_21180 [Candidatus Eremiobacteraeota bacterium]|nr:hypothetical protein [Candidatus Eremiobacteraeota bacterium]MCW5867290.1 hypothetical protein [Candidatus Eremiobacteraeota bacterium]
MDNFKAAVTGLNQGLALPPAALAAAELAEKGDLQAALGLAQSALECADPRLRSALCGLIRKVSHPGAAQVALLCLLGEFSKRPRAMELVLLEVGSPNWVPTQAAAEVPVAPDPAELSESFARSEREARTATLKKLVREGLLQRALQLPLDGDDYQVLWPTLLSQPEVLAECAPDLPVSLLVSALNMPEVSQAWPRLAELRPRQLEVLGWRSPARTHTLPPQPVAFERYQSEAPYYDGGDGALESARWKVRVDESGCRVNEDFEVRFDDARDNLDYQRLAQHDRFFEGLSGGRHQANKACSLSLSADERWLALATLDGAVSLYDLPARQRGGRIFEPGPVSEMAQPVRLRYSAQGGWLAGVRHDQFFLWDGHRVQLLGEAPAGLRGLFFHFGQLWSMCRDGSVYRLDPESGQIHRELEGTGLAACLSPDQRFLAVYRQRVELHLIGPRGLQLLSHWQAPPPVRMHFALEGQALVLRRSEPGKTGLVEVAWRMGLATRSQLESVTDPFLEELLKS